MQLDMMQRRSGLFVPERLVHPNMPNFSRIVTIVGAYGGGEAPFVPDIFMSQGGSDSYDGSTEELPVKTFDKAFSLIDSERRSVGLAGTVASPQTYSIANGTGCINFQGTGSAQPPSGNSKADRVVIRALNNWGAIIDGTGGYTNSAIFLGRSARKDSHIQIRGIKAVTRCDLFNANYVYVKDFACNAFFGIGTVDHDMKCDYNLVEDSWVWAAQVRGLAMSFNGGHNVWRRLVIRGDGCDLAGCAGSGNPNIGFSVYDSHHCSVQNMFIVDRVLNGGYPYGDFATAEHQDYNDHGLNEWLGCASLFSEDTAFHFDADAVTDSPCATLRDCVAWLPGASGFNMHDGPAVNLENFLAKLNHSGVGDGVRMAPEITSGMVRNGVVYGAGYWGINSSRQPSYTNVNGTWPNGAYNQTTCATGCLTSDPEADGTPASIKHPMRVEAGSALKGAGLDGADIGPNIKYRIGEDGQFADDSGFNEVTSVPLWPYPNQDRIRIDMAAARAEGFCEDDENEWTLTKYLWDGGLGNGYPEDLYD